MLLGNAVTYRSPGLQPSMQPNSSTQLQQTAKESFWAL